MVHLDQDGSAFPTFSSSSAEVVLPVDAEVRWAGLYWGARLESGDGGVDAVGNGRQMKLRAPGDAAYRTINASDDARVLRPELDVRSRLPGVRRRHDDRPSSRSRHLLRRRRAGGDG